MGTLLAAPGEVARNAMTAGSALVACAVSTCELNNQPGRFICRAEAEAEGRFVFCVLHCHCQALPLLGLLPLTLLRRLLTDDCRTHRAFFLSPFELIAAIVA